MFRTSMLTLASVAALATFVAPASAQTSDNRPAFADKIALCMSKQGYDWSEVRNDNFTPRVKREMAECINKTPSNVAQGAHCAAWGAEVVEKFEGLVRNCSLNLLDEVIPTEKKTAQK